MAVRIGSHRTLRTIITPPDTLPTSTSSLSEAVGLISFQMSMVNMAEQLLNMEVRELISAAKRAASIRPLSPVKTEEREYYGHSQ